MGGLTQKDIRILTAYADSGNRELYWNYLSQLPGADGYGTLALGVVRNDSLPGGWQTATLRNMRERSTTMVHASPMRC